METKIKYNQAIQADAWTSFNPTIGNLTLGSGGVKSGYYIQIGKIVHFRVSFKLGTSPSVGDLSLTLPVTSVNYGTLPAIIGRTLFLSAGVAYMFGCLDNNGSIRAELVNGTYNSMAVLSSTVPFTWKATDECSITGTYEAA